MYRTRRPKILATLLCFRHAGAAQHLATPRLKTPRLRHPYLEVVNPNPESSMGKCDRRVTLFVSAELNVSVGVKLTHGLGCNSIVALLDGVVFCQWRVRSVPLSRPASATTVCTSTGASVGLQTPQKDGCNWPLKWINLNPRSTGFHQRRELLQAATPGAPSVQPEANNGVKLVGDGLWGTTPSGPLG